MIRFHRSVFYWAIVVSLVAVIFSCSTEKNTFINRTYHSTTAKYNGYFNANELIRLGLFEYRRNYREDYTKTLPIELLPNEEDVVDFYPVVDTAIAKCREVITKHSMPTASKPSKKRTEYAKWIDMNWLLIGKAHYIRRDYQNALETFEYVRKFYADRSSTYIAQVWEAKAQIKLNLLADAQRTLQKLDNRYNIFLSDNEGKHKILYKRDLRKLRRKNRSGDLAPYFPEELLYDIHTTKAELALARDDNSQAVDHLKKALERAKKKDQKARLNFIIGQLLQEKKDINAREFYTAAIKKNAPFEMSFNARINRAMVGGKSDNEIIDELQKMLKEQKYLEYKDQIYYAMAVVEQKRPDIDQAKIYLTRSVFYSLNNDRQKGISYEALGDITFKERDYVSAQKYYDSSSQVIPEDYANYDQIVNKAEQLSELVDAVTVVEFEDSVQRIANLSEAEREEFLENVIKQLKEEERLRKEREARRAAQIRELQMQQAEQNASGNKFYFSNVKAMTQGAEDFRQMWGQREDEDHWRRSNKILEADFTENVPEDSIEIGDVEQGIFDPKTVDPSKVNVDDLTTDILLNSIPLSDSAMYYSNERLLAALYKSGRIYNEELGEQELGGKQFQRVVDHGVENEHNVTSAFELYKMYNKTNTTIAEKNKTYILNNYPNSDYANYLRDPDYFIKKKEMEALALKDYLRSVERFERGLYYPVILKADNVIENEPKNRFRAEYFLLKAMAMGRINNDKTSLLPVLEQAIEEFPDTPVAKRAAEMIEMINNGVPEFVPFDFDKGADIFDFSYKDKMIILIYIDNSEDARMISTKVSDFNREFFSRDRLRTSTQIYDKNTTFVKVEEFKDASHAADYVRDFAKTKKYLGDLRSKKLIYTSLENFKTLLKDQKLEEYEVFFENNY